MKYIKFSNKKVLYLLFSIILIGILSLTIAYAALSVSLNIIGNAEVVASNWKIKFKNINVLNGSVSSNVPTIENDKTVKFNVHLSTPGDFYKFTVDVVNEGTIDAMIESIVKSPDLTEEQAKYLKYEIMYSDGESISSKHLLSKGSTRTLSVEIMFRKDITASDLPSSDVNLNMSFFANYVQADNSGVIAPKVPSYVTSVSGDYKTIGSEIAIGNQNFYLLSRTDSSITLLSKYNLHVGKYYAGTGWLDYGNASTYIQTPQMQGYIVGQDFRYGTVAFSSASYKGVNYSDYEGSLIQSYVNKYVEYLVNQGVSVIESRLITNNELTSLGCVIGNPGNCNGSNYKWLYSTSYWTGTAVDANSIWRVGSDGVFGFYTYDDMYAFGVRPVITISLI